jgi:predicted hydrolase (HD superfamily)
MNIPTRQSALDLLKRYNSSDHLIRHAYAVEAVMRHFAGLMKEDIEKWGIIGLIHDLDYEKYPEKHCMMSQEILKAEEWPDEWIRAVMSHGWGICTDVEPVSSMERVLFTIDELTGLVAAAALVRPGKSILDMEVASVKKKWKAKGFAAGVNREVIEKGAGLLGMPLEYLIHETIHGMRKVANETGLAGE